MGLSVQSARNPYTGKVSLDVANRLLESPRFTEVTYMIEQYFDDTLSAGFAEQNQVIANPLAPSPEQYYIKQENIRELYEALEKLTAMEQAYPPYRCGFTDEMEHPLTETARHFHLSESRAERTEGHAMGNV